MPQSYVNLIYHIVFSTRERKPFLTDAHRSDLYRYVGGIIRERGGMAIEINGIVDHVHILTRLRQDRALSDMIRDFKSGSSGWMHDVFPDLADFNWQKGYGAFTVGASQIEQVRRYIANQAVHHQKHTFEEEFIALLEKHGIEYDPRYVFG